MPSLLLERLEEQQDPQAQLPKSNLLGILDGPDSEPSIEGAMDLDPDKAAKNRQLSKSTGVPQEILDEDSEEVEREQRKSILLEQLKEAPATNRFFSIPENAALAHDDADSLSWWEGIARGFERGGLIHERGVLGTQLARQRAPSTTDELNRLQSRLETLGGDGEGFVSWLTSASEILGQQVASLGTEEATARIGGGLAVGAAGGAAVAGIGAVPGGLAGAGAGFVSHFMLDSFEVEMGNAYVDMIELGIDPEIAQYAALGVGIINAALEAAPIAVVGKPLMEFSKRILKQNIKDVLARATVAAAVKRFAATYAAGVLTETGTEVVQEAVNIAAEEVGKVFSEGEFEDLTAEEIQTRLADIAEKTFKGMALLALPGPGANFALDTAKAKRAEHNQKILNQLKQIDEGSQLAKRDVEKTAEHHAEALRQQGIDEVFIPINELNEALGPEAVNIHMLFPKSDIIDLIDRGGDLRLTPEQFIQHILLTDRYEAVKDHVRMGEDEFTVQEAKEFRETDIEAEIEAAGPPEAMPEVAIAEDQIGLKALFTTADEAGMSPKTYEAYLEQVQRAAEESRRRQEIKRLKQQEREATAEWKRELETVKEQVKESVSQRPVYNALNAIQRERLNRQQVIDLLPNGEKQLEQLPQMKGRRIYTSKREKGGVSPEVLADMFGFADPQIMLFQMMDAEDMQVVIDREAEQVMLKRHGDIRQRREGIRAALESLHNDQVGAVLAQELNALREAQGQGKLRQSWIKQQARRMLGNIQVKDLRPSLYLTKQKREGGRAGVELRKGNRAEATKAKFRQLLNFELARETFRAQREYEKQRAELKKFLKKRKKHATLPESYHDVIRVILEKYGMGRWPDTTREKPIIADWLREKVSEGVGIDIPSRITDPGTSKPYQEMFLSEWKELHSTIKAIAHQGRQENKTLREADKQNVQEQVATISASMLENIKPRQWHVVETKFQQWGDKLASAVNTLLNADTIMRQIDGWLDLGPTYRSLLGRYHNAINNGYHPGQIGWQLRQRQESLKVTELMNVWSNLERAKFANRINIPGVAPEKRMSHNRMLAVLLNLGNEENRQALVDSEQFTEEELDAIAEYASKKDLDFVQSIWDYFKTFWPEVKESVQRRHGYTPERVQPAPLITKHGIYTGGYYPLRYSDKEGILPTMSIDEAIDSIRRGAFVTGHTRDGHTRERKGSGGRPVLLDLYVVQSHTQQVVYDLEVGDAVRDIYKVLYHKDMKKAFRDQGHVNMWKALDLWFGDIATGEIRQDNFMENSLRWLRTGFTTSKLGINVGVALLQPLGIMQASVLMGKKSIGKGLWMWSSFKGGHFGKDSVYKYVSEQSKVMASREQTFHKDIIDVHRRFRTSLFGRITSQKFADGLARGIFYALIKSQRVADTIIWLGAKDQGLRKFNGDEQLAIEYADRMVIRSQASGVFGERTPFERGTINPRFRQTEFVRMFSALISFFMAKTNIAYERMHRKSGGGKLNMKSYYRNPMNAISLASDFAILYFVEAMVAAAIRGELPVGEDDEDENFAWWAFEEVGSQITAGIPIVRDFYNNLRGYPGGDILSNVRYATTRFLTQAGQGELDKAFFKSANNLAGMLLHYPSSQINKTGEAIAQYMDGEDVEAIEFLMGPEFKED